MSKRYAAQFRQLKQLERFDPLTAQKALLVKDKTPALAAKIIREGMQAVFTRLTAPPKTESIEELYNKITSWIEAQPALAPGIEVAICQYKGRLVKVRRMNNDDLRLRIGYSESVYVGFWGRDTERLSTAYAGKWKVAQQARQNLERLFKKN